MRVGYFVPIIRALIDGRLGDAAALKSAFLDVRAYPEIERSLSGLEVPYPVIDLAALGRLSPGTFGRTYADFMNARQLKPLAVSPDLAETLGAQNVLGVRYALLHDAFHVLLGFATDWAGELGVWSFVAAQRYGPQFERTAATARRLYPIFSLGNRQALKAADQRGQRLAAAAPPLIAQPIETYWTLPLAALRTQLGLNTA